MGSPCQHASMMPYLPAGGSNTTSEEGKKMSRQFFFWKPVRFDVLGGQISDLSEENEHTEGSSSGELGSTDGGEVEYKRLLIHFRGGSVWGPHPDAVFQPIAEVFVDLHPRVRRRTWQTKMVRCIRLKKRERDSRMHSKERVKVADFWHKNSGFFFSVTRELSLLAYPVRRFPRGELQMTKRHFGWCRLCQRCSRGPSTSEAGEPA